MKTLLLMRHAKSSWKIKDIADQQRPLNKRGRQDAPRMGELLVERELIPQRILSSSALRTRQTAELMVEALDFPGAVEYMDRLYMAEAEEYVDTLRELPDDIERVMVIGHNPGLETLLQILSGQIESLPTAVIAHLVLPIDSWRQLTTVTEGHLVEIWRPKELRAEEAPEQEAAHDEKEKKGKGKEKEKERAKGKSKKKDK